MSTTILPLLIEERVLETIYRDHSRGWEVYAQIYLKIDQILKAAPTVVLCDATAPAISLAEMLTMLREHFIFDQEAITPNRVMILVTIWSFKTRKVITSEFFSTSLELPLMLAVLDERGVFNQGLH